MRALDADAFERSLDKYESDRRIRVESIENMIDEHTDGGRTNSIRANAELDDDAKYSEADMQRVMDMVEETVEQVRRDALERGVEAAFEHADPASIEGDDDSPTYIQDGGERENSRDYLDRAKLTELLDETGFDGSHQRSNLLRIVDRAMVADPEEGVAFDAQGFRDSMPLRVNDSREEFDDRVSQFVTESRENAQLESDRREFEASLDPFTGNPTTVRGYHIGHKRGWIDDGEIDPALAKDHADDDETRANAEDRGLAKPEGDHAADRWGSTAASRREQRERERQD